MADPIRVDEWLKALAELENRSAEGFTSEELAAATGVSVKTALARMRALIKAGRLRHAGRRRCVGVDGRPNFTPVYQMVQGGHDKARRDD
jgi:predicted ArsR family transcriptional regulator